MKHIVTFIAVAVLVGCASHSRRQPQPQVVPPAETFHAPLLSRTITIVETNSVVSVSGEAIRPRRFIWTPGLTLANAIALAGGFTGFSNRRVLVVRRDGSVERYSHEQAVSTATNSPLLKPFDVVHVGRRFF